MDLELPILIPLTLPSTPVKGKIVTVLNTTTGELEIIHVTD